MAIVGCNASTNQVAGGSAELRQNASSAVQTRNADAETAQFWRTSEIKPTFNAAFQYMNILSATVDTVLDCDVVNPPYPKCNGTEDSNTCIASHVVTPGFRMENHHTSYAGYGYNLPYDLLAENVTDYRYVGDKSLLKNGLPHNADCTSTQTVTETFQFPLDPSPTTVTNTYTRQFSVRYFFIDHHQLNNSGRNYGGSVAPIAPDTSFEFSLAQGDEVLFQGAAELSTQPNWINDIPEAAILKKDVAYLLTGKAHGMHDAAGGVLDIEDTYTIIPAVDSFAHTVYLPNVAR